MIRTIALVVLMLWLMALGYCSGARAATDEYQGCLAYNKPVTLTGTVLLREIRYESNDDAPPEDSIPFPFLILDQPVCMRPSSDDTDVAENMECTLQIADSCSRAWPTVSRVRVTGTLYHAQNWHHHSKVLILAKRSCGLMDGCQHVQAIGLLFPNIGDCDMLEEQLRNAVSCSETDCTGLLNSNVIEEQTNES
jgi:hypothetical protein